MNRAHPFGFSVVPRLVLVGVLGCAATVFAQARPVGEQATVGITNPSVGLTSDPDASSIDKNPATLGFLRSWSGVYLHSELAADGAVGGRGDGFFFASPLPFLSSLVVGAGVQLVRPPDAFPYGNLTKLSLAFAWRLHEMLSFGLQYAHLFSDHAPVAGGIDTLDLSLAGRLGAHFAWALVVRDVPGATVGGVPLQRIYVPELAVRPFGSSRLELAVGARFGERRHDIDPHFRLWVVPYRGIALKADVEWRRDLDLDGTLENDVRVALGLQLDFERVGIAGFGLFGRDHGDPRGHGFSLVARVSGERYQTYYRGPKYLERVELDKNLRGRKLLALLDRLRTLEHDDSSVGVVLLGGEVGCGFAGAEELRAALLRLRKHGRHVLAFLLHADTKGYLVASAAERIVMDPSGDLALTGPTFLLPYFKGTGELLGIRADFIRIGAYKSAPERYTSEGPSPEARASREAYLDDLNRHLLEAISASRKLPIAEVRQKIDAAPYSPVAARDAGLVDEVRAGEDLGHLVTQLTGSTLAIRDASTAPGRDDSWGGPQIAVIDLSGEMVGGASRDIPLLDLRATGLADLNEALERAAREPRIKAIVLRIDSPGGSSMVADLLARTIERIRAWKPVVCSLGDTAASGGYYVASACDEIFAAPSTLAGSIGVYTGKFDLSGLLSRLGVSFTRMERGAHASFDSMFRTYTDDERKTLTALLRFHYERFVTTVARGRHLGYARVDELGQGRIYSGDRARTLELVDRFGGLTEAIEAAAKRAGVPLTTPVVFSPTPPTMLGQLAQLVGWKPRDPQKSSDGSLLALLPGFADVLSLLPVSIVLEPSIPQARLDTW